MQSFGIVWEVPDDTAQASEELSIFSEAGIEYLEISHPIETPLQTLLSRYNFTILVHLNKSYYTLNDISGNTEPLLNEYLEAAARYRSHFEVAGLGLLTNSQVYYPEFLARFSPVLDSIAINSNKSFYFQNSDKWFYFDAPEEPFGKLVFDRSFQKQDLSAIHTTFETEITRTSKFIYFVHARWLLEALEGYPEFKKSLIDYHQTGTWNLPLPNTKPTAVSANWLILLLLLLWGALAVQLKYFPYIRPMMLRYFLSHRFFVDDILQYRERAAIGGILVMIKHAVFGGMVFYISARILISKDGLVAFAHHYPAFAITGSNYVSIFFLGVILILALQALSIFWLYLPAKNLGHLSQIINLYAGSFYLDFLLVTVMVTMYMAGVGEILLLSLGVLFIIIWFCSFNIAAFNASRNMGPNRLVYILLTIVLHALSFIAFVILLLTQTNVVQVLDLATTL